MTRRLSLSHMVSRHSQAVFIERMAGNGLKYVVSSNYLPSHCSNWLEEHVQGVVKWAFSTATGRTTYCFAEPSDAFGFKMRWG